MQTILLTGRQNSVPNYRQYFYCRIGNIWQFAPSSLIADRSVIFVITEPTTERSAVLSSAKKLLTSVKKKLSVKALQNRYVRDLPLFSVNIMNWPIFENEYNASTIEYKLMNRENLRRLDNALYC